MIQIHNSIEYQNLYIVIQVLKTAPWLYDNMMMSAAKNWISFITATYKASLIITNCLWFQPIWKTSVKLDHFPK